MATVIPPKLLTAEEYFLQPGPENPTELVRGEIVEFEIPGFQHGCVCANIGYRLGKYVDEHDLENVVGSRCGIITQRHPDTVRGGDISFYSYECVARGDEPEAYPENPPEIVFEVFSQNDCWLTNLIKVGEYLAVGVNIVVIMVPQLDSAYVFYDDRPPAIMQDDDRLEFPNILPGFSVTVKELIND